MQTESRIDGPATHEKVRAKYRSILRFCKAHKINNVTYYYAVKGLRTGEFRRADETVRILGILRDEGLLVREDDGDQAANG